jgi:hypothetical protein
MLEIDQRQIHLLISPRSLGVSGEKAMLGKIFFRIFLAGISAVAFAYFTNLISSSDVNFSNGNDYRNRGDSQSRYERRRQWEQDRFEKHEALRRHQESERKRYGDSENLRRHQRQEWVDLRRQRREQWRERNERRRSGRDDN